ncbi:hypothetical protein [Chitinophaga lutea]|uniref:hypothetical protein n=1 Tax=Chitinophaga lutea TaxID=2488634 RepID=UPI000F4F9FD0|nr:hypothetical protein [Chitinophaga lutea]
MFAFKPHTIVLCACSLLLLAAGCRKKKEDKAEHPAGERLLMKVSDGDMNHERFEYAGDQVVKYIYYPGFGRDTSWQLIEYSAGRQQKVTLWNGRYMTMEYSGDTLVRMNEFSKEQVATGYRTYRYSSGRLAEERAYRGDALHNRSEYTYDAQGNRLTKTYYVDEDGNGVKKRSVTEYLDYTDHPDPLTALFEKKFALGRKFSPRLWQKEIHRDENGFEEWTTEFSYSFDGQGYPVSRKMTSYNPDRQVLRRSDVKFAYHH